MPEDGMPTRSAPVEDPEPVGFPGCRGCAVRSRAQAGVCLTCFERSQEARTGRTCAVCGQSATSTGICANRWCGRFDRGFSVVFSVGAYEGAMRDAIVGYKYRGEAWWAAVFARLLAGYLRRHATWFEEFDVLTGMPAYHGPGARRRWDPVQHILDTLRPLVDPGWAIADGLVVKTAETDPMSVSTRLGRLAIAEGPLRRSLAVTGAVPVEGARVLVIDDVLTEGSSLREVARVLRRAGAEEVAGLVLARRRWAPAGPAGPRDREVTA